jgi:hypothetical protein
MSLALVQRINSHELYVAMCKGRVAQRSIRSQHGKNKRNLGIVMGTGSTYHGAINIDQ